MTVDHGEFQVNVADVLGAELCIAQRHLDEDTCSNCRHNGDRLAVEVMDIVVPGIANQIVREIETAMIERNSRKAENVNETVYNLAFAAGLAMANSIVAAKAEQILEAVVEKDGAFL